jgi:hypothetical protein
MQPWRLRALSENVLSESHVPLQMLDGPVLDYDSFLAERRRLMALLIKQWFGKLQWTA